MESITTSARNAESGASIEQSLFSAELASDLQLCAAAGAVG